MKRARVLLAGAVLAATSGLVPVAAAPSAPVLAGTTVFTAREPVTATVVVPRAATLRTPFGESPDIHVAATGRLAVFVLAGADSRNRGVTIVGGAGAAGDRFLLPIPQFPTPGGGWFEEAKTYPDVTHVPAGRYRLYVVPDKSPARITLRLNGLSGRATVSPTVAATAEIAEADTGSRIPAARSNAFVGGATRSLARPGLALHVLRSRLEVSAAWQLVMCHDNPESSADAAREVPGCPSGEKHTLVTRRAPEIADTKQFVQGFAGLPRGTHRVNAVFTTQSYATALDYATLWLTY